MGQSILTPLKVGIVSILAIVILFGGILWVKNSNPLTKKTQLSVIFPNAEQLAPGDPVVLSGIKISEIDKVSLNNQNKATIEFKIPSDIILKSDASFSIEDIGLMGDKSLVITPGSEESILNTQNTILGTESYGMSAMMKNSSKIIARLDSITAKIDKDLDLKKISDTFKETANKIHTVLSVYENIAKENRTSLNRSIENANMTAVDIRSFIKKYDTRLDATLSNFEKTSDKISDSMDSLENVSSIVDTISIYLNNGDGTFAKFVKSEELYNELRTTNANLDSLIKDFKKNPGKYTKDMKVKLRLF